MIADKSYIIHEKQAKRENADKNLKLNNLHKFLFFPCL